MRRISSSPVVTCSGLSRRTQEARSVHCSNVSTRGAAREQSKPHHEDQEDHRDPVLTQQDLQSIGVKVQSLRLLFHHLHLLRLLVVVAVDGGVGQHLQAEKRPGQPGPAAVPPGGSGRWRYLASLRQYFTGINDEGQGLHLQRFVDGQHLLLQVDGKVLWESDSQEVCQRHPPEDKGVSV